MLLSPLGASAPKPPAAKPSVRKFPLPLPKSYKMPNEIQEIVLDLYRNADSVSEFRERYKIVYEDKWELKKMLFRLLDQRMDDANSGKYGLRYGDALFFDAAKLKEQVSNW
jgi:hypothetical protein